ncbi:hypothetical protein VTL71DRAFT_7527, partial [Oculimacula yallundae]
MEKVKKKSIFSLRSRKRTTQPLSLLQQGQSASSPIGTTIVLKESPISTIPKRENRYGLLPLSNPTPPSLSSPTARQFPVDIIAIHGITGDAYSTWTDKESSFFWLQDSLPKEFPGARIYSFGYRAEVFLSLDTGDFETFAGDLLDEIFSTRLSDEEKRRPLIFVCHSMGGIVVKKALNTCQIESRYKHILDAVSSILFLATPHGGAKPAELLAILSKLATLPIASLWVGRTRSDLIKSLKRNSKQLHTISKEFRHHTQNMQIFSFIEEKTTPPLRDLLVDEISGSMNVSTEDIVRMPGCDHRKICCFENEKSQGYKKVSSKLREVIEKATTKIETTLQSEDYPCLQSLAFSTMHDRLQSTSVAHPSTCSWLLAHPSFQVWSTRPHSLASPGRSNLLWIKGHPGTGKSTLMAFIHNHFTATYPRNIHVSFFFHGNGTLLQRSQLGMLRSLIHQLYKLSPPARTVIFRAYEEKTRDFGARERSWEWPVEELQILLSEILCRKPLRGEEIVIFVDALDEADNLGDPLLVGKLVEYFHRLNDRILSSGGTTRIAISCRHYPVIATNYGLVINVEEENMTGVELHVKYQLSRRVQGWGQETEKDRHALEQAIVGKAEGVFLWVRLRLPEIVKNLNDGAWSLEMAPRLLEAESNELFTQYEGMLFQNIGVSLRKKALQFLQWVSLAERPLSVSEIRFAMACDDESMKPDMNSCQDAVDFIDSDGRMRLLIQSLSGGLVEVRQHDHGTTVQPFHQTVSSFLRLRGLHILSGFVCPITAGGSNDEVIGAAEQRLSSSCLNYLSFEEVRQAASSEVNGVERKLPFVQYAANNLVKHAKRAECKGLKQTGLVNRLMFESTLFETWKLIHRVTDPRNSYQDYDLIHVMAISDILSGVQELLDQGVFIDQGDLQCNTALYHAAQSGHQKMAELLLERGAKVDQKNLFYGWTPLKIAAFKGHVSIAKLLLKYGAEINDNIGLAGNALQNAAKEGNLKLATILVECGANVNECGGRNHTALQAAALGGHEKVVRYLIDQNADPNLQGGDNGCALQAAAVASVPTSRRQSIVRLLLDHKADIDLQGGRYGNVLQAAIAKGDRDMTKLLLSKGANVKANMRKKDAMFGSALQAACHSRDEQLVAMLLALGVDVNADGGEYGSAIQAASSRNDNDEIIDLLLQHGVDVNQQGGRYGSALQAASECPGALAVDILIKHGADVYMQGGLYGNMLQAAVYGTNEIAAKRFLAAGLDINISGGEYGCALQASIQLCQIEFIRYLLDKGANVNAQGGKFGNALRAAVYWKREQVVQLLLDRGALPDFQDADSALNSPLYLAADRGYLNIVKILLDYGAEVDRYGGMSIPALAAAINSGHKSVVELLLEYGADPDLPDQVFQTVGMNFPIENGNHDMARLLEERRRKIGPRPKRSLRR